MPNNNGSGNNYIFHFFGFKTTSRNKVLTNVSVITYDPEALFRSRYDFTSLSAGTSQRSVGYTLARAKVANLLINRFLLETPQAYTAPLPVTRTIEHVDDVTESDTTNLVIAIIGAVILVILTIMSCIITLCCNKKLGATSANGAAVNQSSFRSATPDQHKFDDMA